MCSEHADPETLYDEFLVSEIDFYGLEIRILRQQTHALTTPLETFDRDFVFETHDDDLTVSDTSRTIWSP